MQYMVVWNIKPEQFKATVARFKKNLPLPKGVRLIARWHEMGSGKGFNLMETDDPVALTRYMMGWADLVDLRVSPVVEDATVVQALKG